MLRPIHVAVLTLATCLLLAASARSDEVLVTLASGDTIRAVIVREADGVLVIRHPVLGELSVPRTQVISIAPAPPADAAARQTTEAEPAAPESTAATPAAPAPRPAAHNVPSTRPAQVAHPPQPDTRNSPDNARAPCARWLRRTRDNAAT
ncbi:MAG: hypothetical protein ACO32J_09115, partial [Phycisphaerales bacterium]